MDILIIWTFGLIVLFCIMFVKIWALADSKRQGFLDLAEFVTAMKVVDRMLLWIVFFFNYVIYVKLIYKVLTACISGASGT